MERDTQDISRRELLGAGVSAVGAYALTAAPAQAAAKPAKTAPVIVVPEPPQVAAKEGMFDVGGARLWYWDTGGDGQAVVFLHPGTGNGTSWVYQQPVFAKAGYRVIGYSRRNSFKSERDANTPVTLGMTSQDIEDLNKLATHLQLGRFHLIGIAAGGFIAARYAVNFPQTLRSVVLGCSLMNIQEPDYQALSSKGQPPNWQDTPTEYKELSATYRTLNPEGTQRWIEIEKKNPPLTMRPGAGGPSGAPGSGPFSPQSDSGGRKPVNYATLREMSTQVPTLLMTGDADLYFNPGLLHHVGERVPAAKRLVLEYSGHAPFWEQPTEFNRMILDFIKSHRR